MLKFDIILGGLEGNDILDGVQFTPHGSVTCDRLASTLVGDTLKQTIRQGDI